MYTDNIGFLEITYDDVVLQGNVLSVALFILAINDVCSNIKHPILHALDADVNSIIFSAVRRSEKLRIIQLTKSSSSTLKAQISLNGAYKEVVELHKISA